MSRAHLLDTNVVSEVSKPRPDHKVVSWLRSAPVHQLSVATVGELYKGLHLMPVSKRRTGLENGIKAYLLRLDVFLLPITDRIAVRWGEISALRQRSGRPISFTDGLIAATALEHGLTLVTRNVKDFTGLELELFDPWQHEPSGMESKAP